MKSAHGLLHWRWLLIIALALGSAAIGDAPVIAQGGAAISSATPSNLAPGLGQQIAVTINIDMSGVHAPDNKLGSFTGTLDWSPAVLAYSSDSGIQAGFTGLVNTSNATAGHITFNGANAMGATGNITVLTITFDVAAEGTSALNLEYSVMAATATFANLLPILTVIDGQVVVGSVQATLTPAVTPVASHTATATEAPIATDTPIVPTATLASSPTPEATVVPTATGVAAATPTIRPTPTQRYWTYLSLLMRKASTAEEHPWLRVLDWRCLSNPDECCQQEPVPPRLFPRLAPFCRR